MVHSVLHLLLWSGAGKHHEIALGEHGTVWQWGYDDQKHCNTLSPFEFSHYSFGDVKGAFIAPRRRHSLVITPTGLFWTL